MTAAEGEVIQQTPLVSHSVYELAIGRSRTPGL